MLNINYFLCSFLIQEPTLFPNLKRGREPTVAVVYNFESRLARQAVKMSWLLGREDVDMVDFQL